MKERVSVIESSVWNVNIMVVFFGIDPAKERDLVVGLAKYRLLPCLGCLLLVSLSWGPA